MNTQTAKQIDFTRINNDINGNPRYVCHFLNLVNDTDRAKADYLESLARQSKFSISYLYDIALDKARKIGGKKFHNKQYGGGISFQSYSLPELEGQILDLKKAPVFVGGISDKQARGLKRAIAAHFSWLTLKTNNGDKSFSFATVGQVDEFLGLAYTSSSSYAGYWVCNVEAENPNIPGFHYVGFTVGTDGGYYAILWDKDENEKILPI